MKPVPRTDLQGEFLKISLYQGYIIIQGWVLPTNMDILGWDGIFCEIGQNGWIPPPCGRGSGGAWIFPTFSEKNLMGGYMGDNGLLNP